MQNRPKWTNEYMERKRKKKNLFNRQHTHRAVHWVAKLARAERQKTLNRLLSLSVALCRKTEKLSGYTCSVLCILRCSIIELSTWIEIVLGKVVVQCLVCWFCFWGAQWCQILLATTKEFLDKVCEIIQKKPQNKKTFLKSKKNLNAKEFEFDNQKYLNKKIHQQ